MIPRSRRASLGGDSPRNDSFGDPRGVRRATKIEQIGHAFRWLALHPRDHPFERVFSEAIHDEAAALFSARAGRFSGARVATSAARDLPPEMAARRISQGLDLCERHAVLEISVLRPGRRRRSFAQHLESSK